MSKRLELVKAMNPEFAQALERCEKWAIQQSQMILGIDGEASRKHPERTLLEDGTPKNWCGTCPSTKGCVVCDLGEDHTLYKEGYVGLYNY